MRQTASVVGERIRRARDTRGLQQGELARAIGKAQAAVSQWETGKRLPGVEDLVRVAAALDVPVASFFPEEQTQRRSGATLLRAVLDTVSTEKLRSEIESFIEKAEALDPPERLIAIRGDDPLRAVRDLRTRAEHLGVWATEDRPAIDVEQVARLCGVRVLDQDFEDGLSGLMVMLDDGAAVGVNKHHALGRRRFTVAHELGHFALAHYDRFHLDLPAAEAGDSPYFDYKLEREANQFAAELLMPEELVRPAWNLHRDVRGLADRFAVSGAAMGYRLINLGLARP